MFRTPLQWLILTSTTFTVFAGQGTPWDNVLEAVLFSSNPTDLDDSGETDVSDLLILISDWGPCGGCSSDFDENGIVNVTDLLTLIDAWGPNEIIDLDEQQDIAAQYRISSAPTMIIEENGIEVDRFIGALPKKQVIQKLTD